MVIYQQMFAEEFKLSIEGTTNFSELSTKVVESMNVEFSLSGYPGFSVGRGDGLAGGALGGLVAISSRRSRVLVLLAREARAAVVVLGLPFVANVEAGTPRRSIQEFRVFATFVGSMDILRECVYWLDLSTPQPHLRVILKWNFYGLTSQSKIPLVSAMEMFSLMSLENDGFMIYALDALSGPVLINKDYRKIKHIITEA
ncbi:hypothetical protein F511_38519 [Dorcoceras hygrometricum]|uniref:Uncharacterized protein n=1 Tax=Dorcoceras hygrometricum TaxID=472368 RepID=A0A2Z7CQG4_9LAMI|nr:hypothetical protein F511_38519 [Dorcoceras hygrometricum]